MSSYNHNTASTSTTGSSYATGPTTSTTGSADAGSSAGEGLKGLFAKGHDKGIGEAIRGNVNSAIDGFTGDSAAQAKNSQIAQGGEREFATGNYERKGIDKAL